MTILKHTGYKHASILIEKAAHVDSIGPISVVFVANYKLGRSVLFRLKKDN